MNTKKYLDNLQDFNSQEILVTGGTSGIGLAIVQHLLYKEAKVVILARNLKKAEEVKNNLLVQYENASISIIEYDQSKEEIIAKAVDEINEKHPAFKAVICNAGVFSLKNKMTSDKEMGLTIKTNYFGLHLFTEKLLKTNHYPHRYIFQGSLAAGLHLKKIKSLRENNISGWQQYLIAKAGVEALFNHYCITHKGPSSFILVEPGLTSTDIVRDLKTPIRQLGKVFLKLFSHSNKKAALTALLALEEKTANHSYIIPRGIFTLMGYPKIHPFPNKRKREYLYNFLLDENIREN